MSRDYYREARVLAARLADAGLRDWEATLVDVLEGGATATEILMGLRWNLRQLVEVEGTGLDAKLRDAANELAEAIDAALK